MSTSYFDSTTVLCFEISSSNRTTEPGTFEDTCSTSINHHPGQQYFICSFLQFLGIIMMIKIIWHYVTLIIMLMSLEANCKRFVQVYE